MKDGVLFRCDSTSSIGLGHLSRCIALAEAFADVGVSSRFLGRFEAGGVRVLTRARMPFQDAGLVGSHEDLATTAAHAESAALTVLDSYGADADYVAALQRRAPPIALIDDFCRLQRYDCAAVLNFTVAASEFPYPCEQVRCCMGPEYFLVRRQLRSLRSHAKIRRGPVTHVLIAMGGVDKNNLAGRVARILCDVNSSLEMNFVVGPAFPHLAELRDLLGETMNRQIKSGLDDLGEEFDGADLCICAGGLTKYEASYMGVPCAVLSQTSDQAAETVRFASRGLAFDLGWSDGSDDETLRSRLSDLIASNSVREGLSRNGLAAFPNDPTDNAARALGQVAGWQA